MIFKYSEGGVLCAFLLFRSFGDDEKFKSENTDHSSKMQLVDATLVTDAKESSSLKPTASIETDQPPLPPKTQFMEGKAESKEKKTEAVIYICFLSFLPVYISVSR
jgi:hypothetical protein